MTQEVVLNLYVDNLAKVSDYSFPQNEEAIIYFRLIENKYPFDMSKFNSLTLVCKNDKVAAETYTINANSSNIVNINGKQLVKVVLPETMLSIDSNYTIHPSVIVNNSSKKLDSFSIVVYAKNSTEMFYVRKAIAFLNDMMGEYTTLIKHDKINIPNGIIPLNNESKIIESYLPNKYRQHTEMSIRTSNPHSIRLGEDGRLLYIDPSDGKEKPVKKQKDPAPEISVTNGVVTITTDPSITMTEQKWTKDYQTITFFRDGNGTEFTGDTFPVTTVGEYSYYYKNVYDKDYVYYFSVSADQLKMYPPELIVFDGAMDIKFDTNATAPTKLTKIASGSQNKQYFTTGGAIIENNFYTIPVAGQYTLYWQQEDNFDYVYEFTVTAEDMQMHTAPVVTSEIYDVTITYTKTVEDLVTLKKFSKGIHEPEWFIDNGTIITENTFNTNDHGAFTYYYKYRNRNYVVGFNIADYSYLVPLSSIATGEEFVFGGRVWTRMEVEAEANFYASDETPFAPVLKYGTTNDLSETDTDGVIYNMEQYYMGNMTFTNSEKDSMSKDTWYNGSSDNPTEKSYVAMFGLPSMSLATNRKDSMISKGLTDIYWTGIYSSTTDIVVMNLEDKGFEVADIGTTNTARAQLRLKPTTVVEKVPKITIDKGQVTIQ